ncbi:MAG: ABC transporter permease [Anaerolineae bacterium]|jgi:ABC-type multidrug transport system permease subunit|nr:ABC transporter permease [Anaerolineae bacterium]
MFKKIWAVFLRDVKTSLRDVLLAYILVVPVMFGFAIRWLAPSVNDTTVTLAMLESDDPAKVEYLEQFARVELFDDLASLEERIERRDNIIGIIAEGDSSYLLAQGNEPESVTDHAKLLNAYHELGMDVSEASVEFVSFGRTEPPLKKMLVNAAMMFTAVLAGMIISIHLVEEKMDNTVAAINVSPISRTGYVIGKSLMGIFFSVIGAVVILWITGYQGVNIGMTIVAIIGVTMLSLVIGFLQGVINKDIMEAAGSIKLLFFPLAGAIAVSELVSSNWQWVAYWVPFYWTYKTNDAVLSFAATWPQVLGYTAIVLALSGIVYALLAPKIKAGLTAVNK